MSATAVTNWELRLRDFVLSPLKRIADFSTVAQNKIKNFQKGLNDAASAGNVMGLTFKKSYSQLEAQLKRLEIGQKNAFTTRHILAYQKMIDKTKSEMQALNSVTKPGQSIFGKFTSALKESSSQIPGLSGMLGLMSNPITIATGAAIALGAGLYKATEMAIEFDKGMAKINTTAQYTRPQLEKLKHELIDLGKNSTVDLLQIPDAYEKIISQTGDAVLSIDILKSSLKASEATATDINVVASALAQTLSVVGKENTNANEVINTLIAAKRVGAGEFSDFAQYVPGLIAAGKNLNIAFKDTAGVFAYMTGKGQSAADSAMLIQNVYTAFSKGDIRKGMAGAGIKLFNEKGEMQRLDVIFAQMESKLGAVSTKQKLAILEQMGLRDAQAKQGISVLMSDTDKLTEALNATNNALTFKSANGQIGELNAALAASDTPANRLAKDMNYFKGTVLEIGNSLMGPVTRALAMAVGFVKNLVEGIKEMYNNSEFLQDVFWAIGKTVDGIGYLIKNVIVAPLKWLWDNVIKPLYVGVEYVYRLIKSTINGAEFKSPFTESKNSESSSSGDNQTTAEKALKNINSGKPAGDVFGKSLKESASGSGISGDKGARTLTMNLTVNQNIKSAAAQDIKKLKDELLDAVIDAARDGMVTIGI